MVTDQLQVECRTGKVRRSKTDVLPTVPLVEGQLYQEQYGQKVSLLCGFVLEERKTNAVLRELLGLEPVSLVVEKA